MYNPGSFIVVRQDKKVMNEYAVKALAKYFEVATGKYLKRCRRTKQPLDFDVYINSLSRRGFLRTWNYLAEDLKNSHPNVYLTADLRTPYQF
jgi:hypothetical protein